MVKYQGDTARKDKKSERDILIYGPKPKECEVVCVEKVGWMIADVLR
jgi:hypothetical protein